MSIEVKIKKKQLVLVYKPDNHNTSFIERTIREKGFFYLKRVFNFVEGDIIERTKTKCVFRLGVLNTTSNYFDIDPAILNLQHNLLIHKDVIINEKIFFCTCRGRHFSVFFELDQIIKRNIIIGGNASNAIPEDVFYEILRCIPTDYEVDKYIDARFASIAATVFEDGIEDFPGKHSTYTNKKIANLKKQLNKPDLNFGGKELAKYELVKYEGIKSIIKKWLSDPEESHSEADWQHLIKNIILLLFPKYIAVFEEAPIEDPYNIISNGNDSTRRLDYLLVDADGNCDIAEIKAPFKDCILSKTLYRNNYVPLRELSGAIMQVEKYIFYMNKKGMNADKKLNEKYRDKLPLNFEIKVTNPKGLIILGRSNHFDEKQKRDFEIIKRKYLHVMDILSYDDILNRLENIISMLRA